PQTPPLLTLRSAKKEGYGCARSKQTEQEVCMKIFLVFVCLVLASVAYVRNAGSAPYSADLVTVTGGRQSTSKVYVGDSRLRTEVTTNSMQVITITRLDEKIVYVLLPRQ